MNKSALKNFATSARRELLERVELQARKIGITSETIQKAQVESSDAIFIDGKRLSDKERIQRNKLISRIQEIGFNRVMEEVAYTWFNRFTALRFMEVNDYLPTKVRVLSSINPESVVPDIMKETSSLDLDLDKDHVYNLKLNNEDEGLFKYLVIKHCNDLNRYMPFMFETIGDYTEILFPEGLLSADSCLRKMTNIEAIPEDNWRKIEVIGWLYQYYIAEEKDRVFKAKKKYKAEEIPFATQLFTPEWIVRYMVQNSLGRYWVEAHPKHQDLIANWEFYLQNTEEGFEEKIAPYINKELKIEEIKCFDPAMGSGHILVYMFDVLYEIYSKIGYMEREIPRLIIENNLFGLDIDDRAYQLASFSIVMKAMEYNKRFLRSIEREGLILNLASIQETNTLTEEDVQYLANGSNEIFEDTRMFIEQFQDAKTIGSLIKKIKGDTKHLQERLESIQKTPVSDLFEIEKREKALSLLPRLIKQARIMSSEFDILVTNPPYMGSGSMNKELGDYLKKNYPDSKADLFAAFMDVDHYLKPNGLYASINQHSWMFLSSYEKLRKQIIENKLIDSMLHLGPRAFEEIGGEVVQSTTFVLRNSTGQNIAGIYLRLNNERTAEEKKEKAINSIQNPLVSCRYSFTQESFNKIPGSPIAYWVSENFIKAFEKGKTLDQIADCRTGMQTGNNNLYMRNWFEVSYTQTNILGEDGKWMKYNCGGESKKWYGNHNNVVLWENNGEKVKAEKGSVIRNESFFMRQGISWKRIGSSEFFLRYLPPGFIFDQSGDSMFLNDDKYLKYILGYVNTKVALKSFEFIAPTLNLTAGNMNKLPIIIDESRLAIVDNLVQENINISKKDWDSSEVSWDFVSNPLLPSCNHRTKIQDAFESRKILTENNFTKLKSNEEELNNIFIEIYNLHDELSGEVAEKDITISKVDLVGDIKSFISYAIGCSLGRYSLDEEGLIYAGGKFDFSRYNKFLVDEDNILPVLYGSYFEDDIVTKFVEFVRVTYGDNSLEENLNFISEAIGMKKNEIARETLRRYFLNDFYNYHIQVYRKRPIYWLFTSGKEKAFNCLIYMHRYDKTTLSRIRTDYLHEVQTRMDAEKQNLLNIIEGDPSSKEISNAKKELKSLDKKIDELKAYDEKLHHMADMQIEIDLDDGVAVNYAKFEGLVAKI